MVIAIFSNIIALSLSCVNPDIINTIINAVIVGCFSLGGIIYTQQKTEKRYQSELNQKDNQMKVQEDFFNDMIIYMSNYPHKIHALIKLKDILNELISVYDIPLYRSSPVFGYGKIKQVYVKSQNFINSPLYYYLDDDIISKIDPLFQELHKKYDTNQSDLFKIQMNKYSTLLTDNQFLVIKNMVPEIESRINEKIKHELDNT
ncbi:hypothetical protein [uncultured Methanobrevibacter sp.]|uniref:hypothetical protein n=1 Tax=uncultured Methanobrevibacter sp. TaxID=253161 RepID=UPI0025D878EB|nr:hypothetical protein [uncultured Methanobrevibacter sp.]